MDHRVIVLVVVVLAVFCAGDAATVVEKLRTRVRAPPLSSSAMPSAGSMSAAESGSVESIAATQLLTNEGSCGEASAASTGCSGAIRWGPSTSSSFSSSSNTDSELPPVNDVIGPIEAWIKAFKKKIGSSGNLADTARALVQPLMDKLKRNQKAAEEKLEESNQAILDTVEKSVTDHVLKLLKAEKITQQKSEQSEARQAKAEAVRDEQSERELRGEHSSMDALSASISQSIADLSQSSNAKSVLEHVSQELEKAKRS